MNVPLLWAQENSNVDISSIGADEVVKKIGAQLGAVESVTNFGARFTGAVIAKVVTCDNHPNADRLHVCTIDDGGITPGVNRLENGLVQVVCGAPNVRAGLGVVWLPPGSTVPASFDDAEPFVLGARELRGVVSNGMIASAKELGIGDDHAGILEITEPVAAGTSFAEAYGLNDVVIDCENKMFTHRPDCFGVLGVARELAGIQHLAFKSPQWYTETPVFTKSDNLSLDVTVNTPLVPRFMAVAVAGVQVGPSPLRMQAELTKVGIRPINNIVDITNWLMYLTGQPLHAYDYDKVVQKGGAGAARLSVRMSKKGESLALLNGKTVTFDDASTILICANNTPIGIGGAMGGADTEVDESTRDIIIECANFDMYNLRKTAMKYGIFTDAVTRFNKGQSPLQNSRVIAKSLELVSELAEGTQASNVVDVISTELAAQQPLRVSADFINVRLGANLSAQEMAQLLTNVECTVSVTDNNLTITPPFWRMDIHVPEDVVEEVGRLYGYNQLPITLPLRTARAVAKTPLTSFKYRLRSLLGAAGANEVLLYSFVHGNLIERTGQNKDNAYKLSNALSPDLQYYRLSLAPSLLEKVHPNIKAGYGEFVLYEIGKAHTKKWVESGLPIEAERLSLVVASDTKIAKNYQGAAFYRARVYADYILNKLGVDVIYVPFALASQAITSSDPVQPFDPDRSAIMQTSNGEFIGVIGEFSATTAKNLKLPDYCAGFELDIARLMASSAATSAYVQLPKFPKVSQDISLKVANDVSYGDVYACVNIALNNSRPANTATQLEPLDIYADGSVKHFSFRITIASFERTLVTKEVNDLLDGIAAVAAQELSATRL